MHFRDNFFAGRLIKIIIDVSKTLNHVIGIRCVGKNAIPKVMPKNNFFVYPSLDCGTNISPL